MKDRVKRWKGALFFPDGGTGYSRMEVWSTVLVSFLPLFGWLVGWLVRMGVFSL